MNRVKKQKIYFKNKLTKLKHALTAIKSNTTFEAKTKSILISQALGKILSEDIFSNRNVPPHSNSAVDGYAIRFKDLEQNPNKIFNISGKSKAGTLPKNKIKKMCTVRVLTGAILPKDLDTVVMEEDCTIDQERIKINKNIRKGINFRKLGEDIKIKDKVFNRGHKLRPQDIGVLSSIGIKKIKVYKFLRVAVFSSGDEIVSTKNVPKVGQLFDSNKPMIISLLEKVGCNPTDLGILPDQKIQIIKNFLSASKKFDLLISSGAMSLGDEDHIKKILDEDGNLKVWRIAIKPGRPVGYGFYKNTPILALPGNPTAAFVTFLMLGIPLINKMSGLKNVNNKRYKLPINFHYNKKAGRIEYLRVKTVFKNGKLFLNKFPKEGAGILTSASWADGLAIIDENTTKLKLNDLVDYISFNEILN